MRRRWGLSGVLLFVLSGLAWGHSDSGISGSSTIVVMAYNVENLWDALDDPDQGDPTYLPMAEKRQWTTDRCAELNSPGSYYYRECKSLDWTDQKYRRKLESIGEVVRGVNGGDLPDILVVEELENRNVLADLQSTLGEENFPTLVHFESPSGRGIDVGILARFPLIRGEAFPVDLSHLPRAGSTRDIVEAEFEIGGERLIVAANHWPSQGNKTAARQVAAQVLRSRAEEAFERGIPFLAAGDFNTLVKERPNPIDEALSGRGALIDLNPMVRPDQFPPATHYYRGKWEPLDRILVSQDLVDPSKAIHVVPDSFEIGAVDFMFVRDPKTGDAIPERFNYQAATGFSDHLPVLVRLSVN